MTVKDDKDITKKMEEGGKGFDDLDAPEITPDEEEILKKELEGDGGEKEEPEGGDKNKDGEDDKEHDAEYWKKKFQESSKEALLLLEQKKKLEEEKRKQEEERLRKLEVTEEELREKYPDWDDMTESEQKLAEEHERMAKKLAMMEAEKDKYAKDREWRRDVKDFIKKQQIVESSLWQAMQGHEDEFLEFASKETRRGMDLDILARAFVHDLSQSGKLEKKEPKRQSMNINPQSDYASKSGAKISLEEAARIRRSNPKRYRALLLKGMIDL